MIHNISRYLMTLALLLTAATGAWAAETVETTLWEGTYTEDGVEINSTTVSEFNAGDVLRVYVTVPESGANFKIVYKGASNDWTETAIPSAGSEFLWINDGDTYKDITFTDADITALTGTGIYIYKGDYSTITKVTLITPASGPEVTINDAKTEASFQMPQYDATATYTIKRDLTVDVTAQVGDGTDGVRYRVKKDGNNKFIPADMEMAAVPALFTVNDGIEQKALTQTQDYIVQIYAIDAEGQPTGDPMTFATFTFEPGIYAVKAVAADGSNYAGETVLSNTFQLFQGYQVEVAAKEFITYYKDEPLYADTETSADAELYTIQSVNGDQATLSAAIQTAPSHTPLLIFNNSDEAKTFLLIPANEEPNLQLTVAPEFVGTLEATTIAASTDDQTNYALNGKQFVWVKNAVEIGANKAWLSISTGVPSARITIVFEDATKITNTNLTNITNGDWYTIDGRKVNAPSKKGIYIMNGRKVVVK